MTVLANRILAAQFCNKDKACGFRTASFDAAGIQLARPAAAQSLDVFQRENLEIGAAIGLHGTDFSVFIECDGSVSGQSASFRSDTRTVFAPLPTIGLFLNARPAKKVQVNARFDWLLLTIGDYTGRLINTQVSASYCADDYCGQATCLFVSTS